MSTPEHSNRAFPTVKTAWRQGDSTPPPRGFTTGEKLRAWGWHRDGWDAQCISLRLNKQRRQPPKNKYKYPQMRVREVMDMLKEMEMLG